MAIGENKDPLASRSDNMILKLEEKQISRVEWYGRIGHSRHVIIP